MTLIGGTAQQHLACLRPFPDWLRLVRLRKLEVGGINARERNYSQGTRGCPGRQSTDYSGGRICSRRNPSRKRREARRKECKAGDCDRSFEGQESGSEVTSAADGYGFRSKAKSQAPVFETEPAIRKAVSCDDTHFEARRTFRRIASSTVAAGANCITPAK